MFMEKLIPQIQYSIGKMMDINMSIITPELPPAVTVHGLCVHWSTAHRATPSMSDWIWTLCKSQVFCFVAHVATVTHIG